MGKSSFKIIFSCFGGLVRPGHTTNIDNPKLTITVAQCRSVWLWLWIKYGELTNTNFSHYQAAPSIPGWQQ